MMLPASWNSHTIWKETGSLDAESMKSLGQWALKLLAVKIEVIKKKSATSAIAAEVCTSVIGPGSRSPGLKSFSKFDGQ